VSRLDLPADPRVAARPGEADAFALDSTAIDLCLKLFP